MFTFLHLFHWEHYQRRTALGLGIVNFNRRCCCVMKNHNLEHNYYYSALHWDVISNAITVEQWYTTSTFHVVNSRSNNQLCHDKYKQIQLTATTNPTQCHISDEMSHTCTHINNPVDKWTCTTHSRDTIRAQSTQCTSTHRKKGVAEPHTMTNALADVCENDNHVYIGTMVTVPKDGELPSCHTSSMTRDFKKIFFGNAQPTRTNATILIGSYDDVLAQRWVHWSPTSKVRFAIIIDAFRLFGVGFVSYKQHTDQHQSSPSAPISTQAHTRAFIVHTE